MSVTARPAFGRAAALTAALALLAPVLAVVVSLPQQAALAGVAGPPPCAIVDPDDAFDEGFFLPAEPALVAGKYVIASEANLVFLSENFIAFVSGSSGPRWREQDFVQTVNLDLSGCLFTPIGNGGFSAPFSGSYDGGGKNINDLTIDLTNGPAVGMFGDTTSTATLENLRLVNVNITGEEAVGGLVGSNGGTIKNSSVTGTVRGVERVGGLAGANEGTIEDSSSTAAVTAEGSRVGGLVGQNRGAGGIAMITNSYATGDVVGGEGEDKSRVGGLVGDNFSSDRGTAIIRHSYATGHVHGARLVGGLVGRNRGVDAFASIVNSYATGDVEGADRVGGLVGANVGLDGGTASIANSYATGDVTATGDGVGGLVGENVGAEDDEGRGTASVVNSYATGDVRGADRVGGLVGENVADIGDASIVNSYATGTVAGDDDVGGLVGGSYEDRGEASVEDSFWDIGTSGQDVSDGGTGKSTAEMKLLATFADITTEGLEAAWLISAGWKPFEEGEAAWGICSAVNQGYPFLLWQFTSDPCSAQVATGGSTSSLALSCEGPVAVRATVVCTVSGGDPGIEILWRAAYNPVFATAGVTLDAAGVGTFRFVIPAAAAGQELTVELVEWLPPALLGVVGSRLPGSVPAGEGPVAPLGLVAFGLLAAAGAALAVRRQVVAG